MPTATTTLPAFSAVQRGQIASGTGCGWLLLTPVLQSVKQICGQAWGHLAPQESQGRSHSRHDLAPTWLSQSHLRFLTERDCLFFGGLDNHQNSFVGTGLNAGFALVAPLLVNAGHTIAHPNSLNRADVFTDATASTFFAINVNHLFVTSFLSAVF